MSLKKVMLASLLIDSKPGFASGDDLEDGVFQIRMNNITRDGALDMTKRRRVSFDEKKLGNVLLNVGDVLFNATNSPELVGKSAYVGNLDEPTTYSNHFVRLRSDPDKLDGSYLARWLHTLFQAGKFKGLCKQWVNQATVSRDSLLALEIPLPSLTEQRRIAAILDKADSLRSKRSETLAQLDRLAQSIFVMMFSAQGELPRKHLDTVAQLKRGPFGGALKKEIFVSEGPMVYEQRNAIQDDCLTGRYFISPKKYLEMEDFAVLPGDLIVSCSGTLGRVAIVPEHAPRGIINQALLRVRADTEVVTPTYLKYALESRDMQNRLTGLSHGTGLQNFPPMSEIRSLEIPMPPMDKQLEFQRHLSAIDNQRFTIQEADEATGELFHSIQRSAFRGDL